MMDAAFGFQGTIQANVPLTGPVDRFSTNDLDVVIDDNIFRVGYQVEAQEAEARQVASLMIDLWSLHNGRKVTVNFDRSWTTDSDGHTHHSLHMHAVAITAVSCLTAVATVVNELGSVAVVQPFYPYSFSVDLDLVEKIRRDPTAQTALGYMTREVIEDDRPLQGIFKAMEEITLHLRDVTRADGRCALARLVGRDKSYVGDLMETANTTRHARTKSRRLLSDDECVTRTRLLFHAYVGSL